MAATTSGPYMPVGQEAASDSIGNETAAPKPIEKKKDPLYDAMFGSQIGSATPAALSGRTPRLDTVGVDTLDEPVIDTLKRDMNNIAEKIKTILMMKTPPTEALNDWELWGPLLMCLGLATTLGASSNQSGYVFTLVFMLVWVGSLCVTANARLLGYRISFFQNVCLLGYGLFPLMAVSALNLVLPLFWVLKSALSTIAFAWATSATVRTFNDEALADRKFLAVYPVGLYYFVFAWLIIAV